MKLQQKGFGARSSRMHFSYTLKKKNLDFGRPIRGYCNNVNEKPGWLNKEGSPVMKSQRGMMFER